MTTHTIGNVSIVVEEISAIGSLHKDGANYSFLDIYLKGGQKVVAEIRADKNDQVGSNDVSSGRFVEMREREINQLKDAFEKVNKENLNP